MWNVWGEGASERHFTVSIAITPTLKWETIARGHQVPWNIVYVTMGID